MIRFFQVATAIACVLIAAESATAAITIQVVPSSAPNFFGSPSWAPYLANANNSLENTTGTSIGDRSTDPTAYETFADGQLIPAGDIIVSGFNSWRGEAGAAAPFDVELGNRLHFGVHILGDGTMQFAGADVFGEITSSDGNVLGTFSFVTSGSYTATRIGIDWGVDRTRGTLDDVRFTSGADTQLIDEFVYVGFGNAYDASLGTGTDQDKIDQAIAGIAPNFPILVTGTYSILDSNSMALFSGSASVNVVPEPGSIALAGLIGLAGVAALRCRRRSMN